LPGDDAAWLVLIQCFTKSFGFVRQRVLLIDLTAWAIYYHPAIIRISTLTRTESKVGFGRGYFSAVDLHGI